MRIYETTFIVNPQTDDSSIDGSVKSVTDIITKNGGKILHEDRMGTRRLAYEIQGLNQGYYTSVVYEGDTNILPLLKQHFKLGESYIRDLTVQFEGSLEDLQRRPEHHDDSDRDDDSGRGGYRERREPSSDRRESAPGPKREARAEAASGDDSTTSEESEEASSDSGDSSEEEKEL